MPNSAELEDSMYTPCKRLLFALFVLPLTPVLAGAQVSARSFVELEARLRIGDTVRIIDQSGKDTQGRVDSVSATSLTVTVNGAAQSFSETTVREIKRQRHGSLSMGAALGALIAGVTVGAACHGRCNAGPGDVIAWGTFAGVGAGVGVITALMVTRSDTVFTAPNNSRVSVLPVFTNDRNSLRFSISF
jgi:hypothetical protein